MMTLTACGGENNGTGQQENASSATESSAASDTNFSSSTNETPTATEPASSSEPTGAPSVSDWDTPKDVPSGNQSAVLDEDKAPIEESIAENTQTSEPSEKPVSSGPAEEDQPEQGEEDSMEQTTFDVSVDGVSFSATFAENAGAQALRELLADGPITISMSDYGGFEKVGPLGQSLPTNNSQITAQSGDIVLYQGNQIVMFYGSNAWSYTRLGKIDDLTGWSDALSGQTVSVTFSLPNESEKQG